MSRARPSGTGSRASTEPASRLGPTGFDPARCERIGNATLYCGDASEIVPTLGRFDAVIADPPYAVPTIVATGRETTRNVGDLSMIEIAYRHHADIWSEALGDEGRAFVFCDGSSYPSVFRAMYCRYNAAALVWNKGRIGMGREFRKSHELIVHGWKAKTPIFSDGVGRADILNFSPVPKDDRIHPAEKPVPLLCELLTVCGPRVLDPFMGSGSTGEACLRMGREFVGIEINPAYFEAACQRLRDAASAGPLFGEAA
jgi:site-specific DNA-methyltransferase (adenine-specific)